MSENIREEKRYESGNSKETYETKLNDLESLKGTINEIKNLDDIGMEVYVYGFMNNKPKLLYKAYNINDLLNYINEENYQNIFVIDICNSTIDYKIIPPKNELRISKKEVLGGLRK